VVKDIILAAGLRHELTFTSLRHGGFTEGADSDWTDAQLAVTGRRGSCPPMRSAISRTETRREMQTKADGLSE